MNCRFYFSILFTIPVKFLTNVGSKERGKFFPSLYFPLHKKNPQSEKTGMGSTTKKSKI
jgi:hypothetical protein